MSTYRKFDKYRQRADFLSDIEYGIDSVGNKWINSGTGTPVFTAAGTDGFVLTTTAAANDTSFIQRGIVSAGTRAAPISLRKGFKFHAVASIDVTNMTDTGGLVIGFAGANANPLGQDRVVLAFDPATGFTATVGKNASPKTKTLEAVLADYVRDGLLDLEVYYDGTDHVQFFAGRTRVLKVDVAFDGNGMMEGVTAGMSPTLGVLNAGTAVANTAKVAVFGYAAQRIPART